MTRLTEVGAAREIDAADGAATSPPAVHPNQALGLLLLAIKTLSQRALIAASNLVTLIGLGTAFWLWQETLPAPSVDQLVGLGLYGLFILGLRFVWK